MFEILIGIGLLGGVITGMTFTGGGLIIVILLLLIPPLFGHTYAMSTISGMLILYSLCSGISGFISYYRNKLYNRAIAVSLGAGSFAGGAIGGMLAAHISNQKLTLIFALLSLVAVFFMFRKPEPADALPNYNYPLSIGFGLGIGTLGGMFGLGAGFLFVPVLLKVFKLQPKQAVGTGLAVGAALVLGALSVQARDISFPWFQGLAVAIGGIVGAQLGSILGRHMNPIHLRRLMAAGITVVALKNWIDLFTK